MSTQSLNFLAKNKSREDTFGHRGAFKEKVVKLELNNFQHILVEYLSDMNNWRIPSVADLSTTFGMHRNTIIYNLKELKKKQENPLIPPHLKSKL